MNVVFLAAAGRGKAAHHNSHISYIYIYIYIYIYMFASPPLPRIARRTPAESRAWLKPTICGSPRQAAAVGPTDVGASEAHGASGASVCPPPRPEQASAGRVVAPLGARQLPTGNTLPPFPRVTRPGLIPLWPLAWPPCGCQGFEKLQTPAADKSTA